MDRFPAGRNQGIANGRECCVPHPLLGSGSEEDNLLYLKYYADDDWRRHWHEDFPSDPIPPHEDLPYDRDRLLPKPNYGPPTGREPN